MQKYLLISCFLFLSCVLVHAKNIDFLKVKGVINTRDLDTVPYSKNNYELNDCLETISLINDETNLSYVYWASKSIAASNNYRIDPTLDIKMKAGETIVLKASTTILRGSKYLAKIEPCGNSCKELIVYPKFFTPNGDGFNDYWKIVNLEKLSGVKLIIFDRYGKLLKDISFNGEGWDGLYMSSPLPSTDYWFVLTYIDCDGKSKRIKSHFALKR